MATLFGKDKRTISEHIGNIFKEGELDENSVVRKFRTTAADGKNYAINHYNLDVIISVGYRVKAVQGTQFRIWATQRLKEYIIKGFTLNDDREANTLNRLQKVAIQNGNLFEALMEATKHCSLGQITHALYEVGGQYRRNM
jgi:hypothetical protein